MSKVEVPQQQKSKKTGNKTGEDMARSGKAGRKKAKRSRKPKGKKAKKRGHEAIHAGIAGEGGTAQAQDFADTGISRGLKRLRDDAELPFWQVAAESGSEAALDDIAERMEQWLQEDPEEEAAAEKEA